MVALYCCRRRMRRCVAQTARLLERGNRDLADLLQTLRDEFDVVLIDTPAGDTVFGRQALVAADEVIVPMLPGYHELRALTRVLDVVDERASQEATRVHLLGVLVVNADPRWRTTREYGKHLAAMSASGRDLAVRGDGAAASAGHRARALWAADDAAAAAEYGRARLPGSRR